MKSRFLIGFTCFLIATSTVSSSAIDTPSRSLLNLSPGTFAFVFNEGAHGLGHITSKLVSRETSLLPSSTTNTHLCTNFSDPRCNSNNFGNFEATTVLNPCVANDIEPCVSSLTLTDKEGKLHKASLVRTIDGPKFPKDSSVELFNGGSTSLWHVSDFPGIKDYAVAYFIESSYMKVLGEKKFTPLTFSAYIYPFVEKAVPSATNKKWQEMIYPDGRIGISGTGHVSGMNCIWTENGKCGLEQEFDEAVTMELKLNVPASLTGWLHGRLVGPEISVTSIGNSMNELTVRAKPADVPSAYAEIPYSQTTDEMKQLYKFNAHAMSGSPVRDNVDVAGSSGFKYMSAFQGLLGDKAQLKSTSWKFGRLDGVQTNSQNNCLQSNSKILGLVTTNSMLYEDTLPKFENGSLNYKVGGLHFNPDGTTFKGMYDLVMRSETARCLYGFSNAPLSAEISVISAEGEKQVATTQLSESKDWIHLSAYNFGFSSPTIQMKLKQEIEPSVAPTPSASPAISPSPQPEISLDRTNSALKKTTIRCVKGKTTKKVTATIPKCPAGYKKK
jgi:hypothetical protein